MMMMMRAITPNNHVAVLLLVLLVTTTTRTIITVLSSPSPSSSLSWMMVSGFAISTITTTTTTRTTRRTTTTTRTRTRTAAQQQRRLWNQPSPNQQQPEEGKRRSSPRGRPGRQPWNVFRFLQQSSQFVSFSPPFLVGPFFKTTATTTTAPIPPGQILWQPATTRATTSAPFQWSPLDDVIMGGASYSTWDQATGVWQGTVTDDNNGGFVGIRSTQPLDLSWDLTQCTGLEFTFRRPPPPFPNNDKNNNKIFPRRLKVVVRDSIDFNGIAWSTTVDLDDKNKNSDNKYGVVQVRVPLFFKGGGKGGGGGRSSTTTTRTTTTTTTTKTTTLLIPTRFARTIPNAPPLNASHITGVQLVYSKFELDGQLNAKFDQGDFGLQLVQLRAY